MSCTHEQLLFKTRTTEILIRKSILKNLSLQQCSFPRVPRMFSGLLSYLCLFEGYSGLNVLERESLGPRDNLLLLNDNRRERRNCSPAKNLMFVDSTSLLASHAMC